jgi:hypothetical protein
VRDRFAVETHTDPLLIRARVFRWRRGVPVRGVCWFGGAFDAGDDLERERVERGVEQFAGVRFVWRWNAARGRVGWRLSGDQSPRPEVLGNRDRDRAEARVRALIPGGVVFRWASDDEVEVRYPPEFGDEDEAVRARVEDAAGQKLGGRWSGEWVTEEDRVVLRRRPPMPGNAGLVPVGAASQRWLPIGVTEDGNRFGWDFDAAPHGLVIGSTGAGKTTLIRSIVLAACAAGWTVVCLDPKRIELSGLRGWPGVRLVATRIEDMVTVMQMAAEEVDARYAAIEAETVDEDELPPLLIVLDEVTQFVAYANAFWRATGERGTEHPVVEHWRTIARLGRSGKVHLLAGTQRPDVKAFGGGEARDNFAFRVGVGPLSQDASRMLFGRSFVGRDVPQDAKGRATVAVGARDDATEVQCYWTPRIGRRGASGDEVRYLDEVRAAGERAPHDALPGLTMGTVTAMGDVLAAKKDGGGKKPASSSRRRRQPPRQLSQEQPGLLAVKPDNE